MTSIGKQYNYCLDYIKGIACIFVVWMHCEFPGILGIAVQAVSRFSVPLFFMVSGYFCFSSNGESNLRRKIGHVAKITFYSCLFYLCFKLFLHLVFQNQSFILSFQKLVRWMVFNTPPIVAGQYWFLFALLYTYIFFFIIRRFCSNRSLYLLAALMFIIYILLAQGTHLAGIHLPNHLYRNWLVEGYAFFMLGHFLHEYQDRINVNNSTIISIMVVFTILCWFERYILGRDFGVNICTIPQVTAMMLYAIKNPMRHKGMIQELGKRCSMFVYILHPAIWHLTEGVYKNAGVSDNMTALYLMPIIVVIATILISFLCDSVLIKTNRSYA